MNPPFPRGNLPINLLPPGQFPPNMISPLPMNLLPPPGQFPMGGIPMPMMPLPVGLPPNPAQVPSLGITVPTGVTSVSAPPVRKITPSLPNQQNTSSITSSYGMPMKPKPKSNYNGPIITVFVGNINEKISDIIIRQILDKCGNVTNWKRVKGPNGKLQGFGYCDYAEADSALRAIRLLRDFEIGDKKLLIKVDSKTEERLNNYSREKELTSNVKELNEELKKEDDKARELINQLLKDNEAELNKILEDKDNSTNQQSNLNSNNSVNISQPNQQLNKNQIPPEPNLQNFSDMDIEDEKKTLIHREIGKFRNTYKKQDEEKERLEAERERERELRRERDKERNRERDRERDRERERDRDRERDRNRLTPSRDRKLNDAPSRYDRERDRESSRYNDRFDRESSSRSNYDNDESIERRRTEREERKKELAYQKRLRDWESREERKKRQYEKEKFRLIDKKKEEEREILKLKQFLEDYNDDLDDIKYYKGNNLLKKLSVYEKELDEDERDRQLERKELDDLRKKLAEEGHPDPELEAKNIMLNKSSITSNKHNNENTNNGHHNNNQQQQQEEIHVKAFTLTKQDNRQIKSNLQQQTTSLSVTNSNNTISNNNNNNSNNNSNDTHITPISDFTSNNNNQLSIDKKKKLSVLDVFNSNEDEDNKQQIKKRKLPVFIDDTDSNQSLSNLNKNSDLKTPSSSSLVNSDDKRKQIKAIIDNIPTTKEDLFKHEIEWDYVDSNLMEKRIRPWINKKITEYIGEEEKALLDFICGKLKSRCDAQNILDDVAMVLDDEAEVFIVKMLRLLIYEIEAKKLKLC